MTSNIKINVDPAKKTVTITIDYGGPGSPSGSGKSMIFASTEGNAKIGDELILGLNLYRKK